MARGILKRRYARRPGVPPWNRYANPEDATWDTQQMAGVSLIVQFLDDVIRSGYAGQDESLVQARDAGERYLRESLLPAWSCSACLRAASASASWPGACARRHSPWSRYNSPT